jgi:hypothetical protein
MLGSNLRVMLGLALIAAAIGAQPASAESPPGKRNCGGDATTRKGNIKVLGTSCAKGRAVIKVYRKNLGESTQMIKGFTCMMLPSGNISRVRCTSGARKIYWDALLD